MAKMRLVATVAVAALIPTGQVFALSQGCSLTTRTFTSNAVSGSTDDVLQPFSFTVPAAVRSIAIDAGGAQGGNTTATPSAIGGKGAEVAASVPVTPGDTLCVIVGVRGATNSGLEGGGGGGSFVYRITTGDCAGNLSTVSTGNTAPNLLIAVGGGGGGGESTPSAGGPGRATGLAAGTAGAIDGGSGNNSGAGTGGTGGNGGAAGTGTGGGGGLLTDGGNNTAVPCAGGKSLRNRPTGGSACASGSGGAGGFGGGGGAGGGGGYNGGGGAAALTAGAGGGGSYSIAKPSFAQDGQQSGSGAVSLCYPTPVPTLSWWARLMLVAALLFSGLMLLRSRRAQRP